MVSINFVDTGLDDRILKSIPVDNYPEELMKAVRDRTKLVPKVVVDKNGHRRTVLVRPDKGSNNKGNSGSSISSSKDKVHNLLKNSGFTFVKAGKGDPNDHWENKDYSIYPNSDGTYEVSNDDGEKTMNLNELKSFLSNKGNSGSSNSSST